MKTLSYGTLLPIISISLQHIAAGIPAQSDGSDGALHPGGNITINLAEEAPDGVLNYTTINIPQNVTVRFSSNPSNTPVFLAATGDVVIAGTINVSSGLNPGGYSGGIHGTGNEDGTDGQGPGGGEGGSPYAGAGGGAGMATIGLTATSRSGPNFGAGGPIVPRPDLTPGASGTGGSGGGGGSGSFHFAAYSGGNGGEGGGALQISTPGNLLVSGTLLANGGGGGNAHATALAQAGPGAGGSGGTIELHADTIEITSNAVITATGGRGGKLSTEAQPVSCGANGSIGYLTLVANEYQISPLADIHDIAMAPVPFQLTMTFATTNEYQLQYSDCLLSNDWQNIGVPHVPGSGETNMSFTDLSAAGITNRFYRLRMAPER